MYIMEKALDWTLQQKQKGNEIATKFLEGKIKSIPKE